MRLRNYQFLMEAVEPIAHHEGVIGNLALAMRRKVRQRDGTFSDVPCISGDCLRHGMREAATYALLDAADLLGSRVLTAPALRLLFNGGMVSGRGDAGAVNLDQYRELVDLVPPLALFGGCASNRVVPGRLVVYDAQLVCTETERWWPEWARQYLGDQQISSCRSHVEEVMRVRMDPALDPSKRLLLTEGEQAAAERQLSDSELAHTKDDAIGRDETKSTMMPRTFERIVQGSLFTWGVAATTYSELDDDTLLTALGVFLARPVVGGKKGTGHGLLRCIAARDIQVMRPSESATVVDPTALGPRVGDLFRSHVRERKERIAEFLAKVVA